MKDLLFRTPHPSRDPLAAAAFIVAFLTNLYAVVRFDRPWYELFTVISMSSRTWRVGFTCFVDPVVAAAPRFCVWEGAADDFWCF